LINEQEYALSELLLALIRKGALSDDEARAILENFIAERFPEKYCGAT
jgi:hypothetical protein